MSTTETGSWPSIPLDDWLDTRDTLHLYTQIVGKVRLANEPLIKHWWNSTLYVSAASADWDRATLERTAGGTHA
jgi:hypothetical protein